MQSSIESNSTLDFSSENMVLISKNGRATIGKGIAGHVQLVRHKSNPGKQYAMKTIDFNYPKDREATLKEIKLHKDLRHANIIRVHGYKIYSNYAQIFMEYAEGGDLFHLIRKNHLSTSRILSLFWQCVSAVEFLHRQKILHRDIKPENILIGKLGDAKLADFGWAARDDRNMRKSSLCGTPEYMAPEILGKSAQSDKVDVWSLGKFKLSTNSNIVKI